VACLHPRVIRFGLSLALRALRRPPLEGSVGRGGMARALAWTTFGWLCYGAHAWFLISVFAGTGKGGGEVGGTFALSLGGYALAWAVGFLIIFFPGGIGPREVALIAVLAPVMPSASALVVALASRVVMTLGDLAWAGTGLVLGSRGKARAKQAAGPAGTPPSPAPDPQPVPQRGADGPPRDH
jgi:glycosyltransferase 2 family protein